MCKDCGLPSFRYQDLRLEPKSFSIRLLKLHPAGVQGADIVIELVTTDSDNPSYDALSWCWGKGGPTRPVRARSEGGDHCLRISTNLESALRQTCGKHGVRSAKPRTCRLLFIRLGVILHRA